MKREFISKEDRLKVYQLAVHAIETADPNLRHFGLCHTIGACARSLKIDSRLSVYITQFPEIFKFAPPFSARGCFWWPIPEWKIRRRVLLSAIEDLKSKM